MRLLRKLVVTVAAFAVSTVSTLAADVPGYPPLSMPFPTEKAPQRVELSSGWYLRGDLAYRFQGSGDSSSGDITMVPALTSSSVDNTFVAGFGGGLKMGWFRMDLTGDYGVLNKYQATTTSGSTITGKIASYTVMGNGYVDLGTWYGITPYIGGGIGAANLSFQEYSNQSAGAGMSSSAGSAQRWNLAWSVMAGASYSIAPNLLLDVGYRHIDMGDVSGGPSRQLTVQKLTGDEIRLGIRYLID